MAMFSSYLLFNKKLACEQSKVISKRHATAERKSLSTAERVHHLVGCLRGQVVEMVDLQQLRMQPSIVKFRMIHVTLAD